MRSDAAALQMRYDFMTVRQPPGRIRFNESDACTVPLDEFDWQRVTAGFEIRNLPNGVPVIYEFGAMPIVLKAPGEPVVIR